jgi:outer membrane biosynthesis protein TonB
MLPDDALDEQRTIPVGRKPTPPPVPPENRAPPPTPGYEDDDFEPSLARALEGETMLAPAAGPSGGTPAWLQGLLLFTLVAGVGVAGWLLWSRSGSSAPELANAGSEAAGAKGPITGTVNGLETDGVEAAEPDDGPEAIADEEERAAEPLPSNLEEPTRSPDETGEATAAQPPEDEAAPPAESEEARNPDPPEPVDEEEQTARSAPEPPAPRQPAVPAIPTQNLPRDPARASDVLVHRARPMIRDGRLSLAEATLDRAWELDPRNPQAMAGYAELYIARGDAARALKWAKKAVKKRSRRASYHVIHGDALKLNGDLAGARKAWRRALSIDPENRAARTRLAKSKAQASK